MKLSYAVEIPGGCGRTRSETVGKAGQGKA